jgi:hypothetical protein
VRRIPEIAGAAAGVLLAPVAGAVAWARRARVFHPEGAVYAAEVFPAGADLTGLGQRLAGPALVRMSTAVWRGGREWIDVLGCAIRFRRSGAATAEPEPGDQDLLLATVRNPWTTLLAPLTTEQHDFLRNDYYAVSPFSVDGLLQRVKLRAVAMRDGSSALLPGPGLSRGERLDLDVRDGRAVLELQAKAGRGDYAPVARIALRERVAVDQERLRFSPFRDGRGIRPRGFVHALRLATYSASQQLRPRRA